MNLLSLVVFFFVILSVLLISYFNVVVSFGRFEDLPRTILEQLQVEGSSTMK